MTKQEAIELMKKGERLSHYGFTPDEWIESNSDGSIYTLEDGVKCTFTEFWIWRKDVLWLNGWNLVKSNKAQLTPIEQQHLEYIQSEVIPMTDEQRAADHADISVRFAIEVLKDQSIFIHSRDIIIDKIKRLEKTLNKGCGK